MVEARDVKGLDSSGSSDPVVFVTCFGEKKHTDIKKRQANPTFDTMLFFDSTLTDDAFGRSQVRL